MTEKQQVVSILVKDNIEMITACFDEYYFIIPESVIKPIPRNAGRFKTGELLPVKGETYEFPKSFNIIDLHFKLIGKIRDGRLFDIESLNNFKYDEMPSVNMMGYGIKLNGENDFESFKKHFSTFSLMEREKLAAFANKWFNILEYRTIRYM
ncbi:MAG TPA: hypothetical protein VF941_13465 [Clostridia bacterium]